MVGSALQSHSLKNPFTAGERIFMIRLALNEMNIDPTRYYIIPVTDLKIHSIWIAHVKSLVPTFDIVYSNEPLTRRLFLEANFPVESIPFYKRDLFSSTEIRKRMILDKNWQEFLPKSVVEYIQEINGIKRLKDLDKTDKLH
jgi:nicotinamide-nucleotide adenylyltransferase